MGGRGDEGRCLLRLPRPTHENDSPRRKPEASLTALLPRAPPACSTSGPAFCSVQELVSAQIGSLASSCGLGCATSAPGATAARLRCGCLPGRRPCSAAGARRCGCPSRAGTLPCCRGAARRPRVALLPGPSVRAASRASRLWNSSARFFVSSAVNRSDVPAPSKTTLRLSDRVHTHRLAASTPAHVTASLAASLALCWSTAALLSS